jgi:hypothetical protein
VTFDGPPSLSRATDDDAGAGALKRHLSVGT